jgi:hypothetical protein
MKRSLLRVLSAEKAEFIGLWLIIAGLVGEAVLIFWKIDPSWERPLTFVFTVAIALGVWIESVGASDISSEKDARIAEANARALEAQLALEKYKARRHLSQEQWHRIVARIAEYGPQQFDVAVNNADPEAQRIATSIFHHLWTVAKWRPIHWVQPGVMVVKWEPPGGPIPDWGINTMTIGVQIQVIPSERDTLGSAAAALAEALNAEGVETKAELGVGSHSKNANTIHILVGQKP